MEQKQSGIFVVLAALLLGVVLLGGVFLLPWRLVSWGDLRVLPVHTITVVGEAKTKQKNQVATYSAGVSSVHDDKQVAIDEVNRKAAAIIEALKEFGIVADDIETQSLNVYQGQDVYYEEGRQKTRPGQWNVSNSIQLKLRDVDRAEALANILTRSGATTIYGPSFSLDDTSETENSLLTEAFQNAKEKGEIMARTSERKIRRVASVSEGYQPVNIYRFEGGGAGGGGGAVEPGTGMVIKIITVTFELE